MPEPVTVRDIDGKAYDVRPEDVESYRARGFQVESPEQRIGRVTSDVQTDLYGGLGGKIASFGAGALRTATLGLSDVAGEALGAEHTLRALRDENPIATLGGELVGAFAPVGPAHALTGLGRKIVGAGESAGVLARAGIATGAAAVEGAGFGGGMYLSQVALDDKPLAAEGFIGAMGHGALFAAPVGGVFSLGESTLLRARQLFPQQQVTREAARGVQQEATSAITQSVADGDQMAQAIAKKIELLDAKIGMAESGERVTRRMFGEADPMALGDQVAGAFDKTQLAEALQKYQASRAQLHDWIRHEADPELEAALAGLVGPEVGEVGGRIEKRAGAMFQPELAAGTPVSPEFRDLNEALDMRARQIDVTKVGKRPANDVVPEELIAGVGKPVESVAPREPTSFTKTDRPAGGSQGGAWYSDEHGQQWFGKSYGGETDRVENEHLANQLYRMFGVSAPETKIVTVDGKRVMMSREIQGKPVASAEELHPTDVKQGFVMDAWLGNRDVVGTGFDNIIVSNHKAHRIDNGGATIFRAQGGDKTFYGLVKELDSLRDSGRQAGQVFGKLTDEEVNAQLSQFSAQYRQNKAAIDAAIDGSGLSAKAKQQIKTGLHDRATWLQSKARVGKRLTDDEFQAMANDAVTKLTPEEIEASKAYTGQGLYAQINAPLRERAGQPGFGVSAQPTHIQDLVKHLDAATQRSAADKTIVVSRGVSGQRSTKALENLKPGDAYYDPGFVSTSYAESEGADWVKGFGVRQGVEIRITVPAGYPSIAIPSQFPKEREILLGRNGRFVVTGSEVADDGHKVLHMVVRQSDVFEQPKLPEGFGFAGKNADGRDLFDANPDIVVGVPKFDDVTPMTSRRIGYVVRPSELADVGVMGKAGGSYKWTGGLDLPAIEVDILAARAEKNAAGVYVRDTKAYVVKDGAKRLLAAAAEGNKPVLVKFFPSAHSPEHGIEGTVSLVDDLRRAIGGGRPTAAASADDLTSALQGTAAKLDTGQQLGTLSKENPAAADYASKKLAKRADDAAYFRAKHAKPTGLEDLVSAQSIASKDVAADDFFAQLTRPKTRDAYVAQNIGRAMREEGSHAAALAKVEREWAAQGTPQIGKAIVEHAGADETKVGRVLGKRTGKNVDMGPDLAMAAKAIGDHEASIADMADVLGAEAPVTATEHAKLLRAARAAQADASAASFAKAGQDLTTKVQPMIDIGHTRSTFGGKTVVDDEITKALRAHDARAKIGADKVVPAAVDAASPRDPKAAPVVAPVAAVGAGSSPQPAPTGSVLGKLADVGTALEVLQAMGVHVPDIGAIPVIGPVLSLFLKARAVLSILGRKGGSIPRSTEGLVASKSTETRNRLNAATTALLEGGAKASRKAASYAAGPAVLLGTQLFPGDGDTKSKDPRKLYEARIDELTRAQQPGAIAAAIGDRIQTSDAVLHDAIIAQAERGLRFLDSKAPKQTLLPGMLPGDGEWHPSKALLEEFGKYVHAVNDPASVLEDLAKGHISIEGAETLRVVYPALFAEAQRLLLEAAPKMQKTMPYSKRVAISVMYQIPIDGSMTPQHMQFLQPPPTAGAAPMPGGPPGPPPAAPALTAPLQAGQQTMSPLDRRAGA